MNEMSLIYLSQPNHFFFQSGESALKVKHSMFCTDDRCIPNSISLSDKSKIIYMILVECFCRVELFCVCFHLDLFLL